MRAITEVQSKAMHNMQQKFQEKIVQVHVRDCVG